MPFNDSLHIAFQNFSSLCWVPNLLTHTWPGQWITPLKKKVMGVNTGFTVLNDSHPDEFNNLCPLALKALECCLVHDHVISCCSYHYFFISFIRALGENKNIVNR